MKSENIEDLVDKSTLAFCRICSQKFVFLAMELKFHAKATK